MDIISLGPSSRELFESLKKRMSFKDVRSDVIKHLEFGDASKTDATLTRTFDPQTGSEVIQREIRILINKSQTEAEIVMDIIHELVHATTEERWNPYDPGLSVGQYIQSSIEGEGGEIEAVFHECKIGSEVLAGSPALESRCGRYFSHSSAQSLRKQLKEDFYKVGNQYKAISTKLGNDRRFFSDLSQQEVVFYSSTFGSSYPVSLAKEFDEMTKVACSNVRKRLSELQNMKFIQMFFNPFKDVVSRDQRFYQSRCL